jgi:urea carboxylase
VPRQCCRVEPRPTFSQALFKESAVFLEKFITRARHIEVQIFGNGTGHVIHAGERECSVQRRHQKVIEESPCVLFSTEEGKGE